MNASCYKCCGIGLFLTVIFNFNALAGDQGVAGCLATACHGSNVPSAPIWQRAGKIWFDQDPHAQAYTSLLTETSATIVSRLANQRLEIASSEYREILETKCVSCHATESEPPANRILGADCQVCHGNAEAWGSEHYSSQGRDRGTNRFRSPGILDVESMRSRATICASCHIGELNRQGHNREVDHRLLAAGHPTMHFDFETYMRRYPAHWKSDYESVGLGSTQGFERWRIGKMVAAETRLRLLVARADRASDSSSRVSDWPELSEYSCYDCHRSLLQSQFRPSTGRASSMHWDQWTLSQLDTAIELDANSEYASMMRQLKGCVEQVAPDAKSVSTTAETLRLWLGNELRRIPKENESRSTDIAKSLRSQLEDNSSFASWESATQWYITTRVQSEAFGINSTLGSHSTMHEATYANIWGKWTPSQKRAFPAPSPIQFEVLESYRTDLLMQLLAKP